jgi:hypothetical protein
MGGCFSIIRAARIDPPSGSGVSDAPYAGHIEGSSSRRRTQSAPGALTGLARRNEPNTEAARESWTIDPPIPGLLRMPTELIWNIADNLESTDLNEVGGTCRALRHALQDEKRSRVLAGQARGIREFTEAMGLLAEIQTDISKPSLWAGPLEALATIIDPTESFSTPIDPRTYFDTPRTMVRHWSNNERAELFDGIRTALAQVPPERRGAPLATLAASLRRLSGRGLTNRYNALLPAIMNLPPEHRARPLIVLAGQLRFLSTSGQQAMFAAFIDQARQLPVEHRGEALEALAMTLRHLPQSTRKFDTLIDETKQLPAQFRGPALTRLAQSIPALPLGDQSVAFEHAVSEVEQLAPPQRTSSLTSLISQISELAEPARTAAFDHAFRATVQLNSPEHNAGLLIELARALEPLPHAVRTHRHDAVMIAIGQLPQHLRAEPLATLDNVPRPDGQGMD